MNALERISQIINKLHEEKASVGAEIEEYLHAASEQIIKDEKTKKLSQYLVISEYIEAEITTPPPPFEKLSAQEKAQVVQLLNKRLAQVNNTQEKTQLIASLVLEYIQQNIPATKVDSFIVLFLKRVIEQIKAQVSTNKESALGYAYLIIWLSQKIPNLLRKYKYTMFTSALPLDCLLGMYRVYFTILKQMGEMEDAWSFIHSLLKYTEDIGNTFNPCVLAVFLDVLQDPMRCTYREKWMEMEAYIQNVYIPAVDPSRYKTEMQQISDYLKKK
ncbi:hypothetical protein NEAUS03_1278 [Nematocida ausubeli]|nr:hypothetical protein NEAUS03_1278 [Nematocida ausubeli]